MSAGAHKRIPLLTPHPHPPATQELSKCLCVNVVGYDYRGYGCSTFKESSGLKVSEESVNEDLEAVYAYTVLCHGITPTNVFLFGRSLGSSPSAHLASILTCSNPGLNLAKLACVQHTKIFERIRRHAGDSMKTPLLGGLVLQSAMKVSE